MIKQRKGRASKLTALLLSLMMAVVFMPTFAFADDGDGDTGTAADPITVYMTVSDQGTIAQTKDGEPMAWKEVEVTDLNQNGKLDFDDALVAAHAKYNSAEGYVQKSGGVKKIWNQEPVIDSGFTFLKNGSLTDVVTLEEINDNDYLTAAIVQDNDLSLDLATSFDANTKTVAVGDEFTLDLKGYYTLFKGTDGDFARDVANVDVGILKNSVFNKIEGKKTDSKGQVTLSFDEPGTYIVTAQGPAKDTLIEPVTLDSFGPYPIYNMGGMVIKNSLTMDYYVGYTQEDYDGEPCPYSEVYWMDYMDYINEEDPPEGYDYEFTSESILYDNPITAPCCIVTVKVPADPAKVSVTVNNKGMLAEAKDGSAMVEKQVEVTDRNIDGKLTIDEALIAAHEQYFEDGAEGFNVSTSGDYASYTKLWGVETTNTLTYINDSGIYDVVGDVVASGDKIYTSVNADDTYYADWKTSFNQNSIVAVKGVDFKLNLKGHYGMAYTPEDLEDTPLKDIQIGTWEDGSFKAIDGVKTDEEGNASVVLNDVGPYLITAQGTVPDQVYDYSDYPNVKEVTADCPIMAPYCTVTVINSDAVTEAIKDIKDELEKTKEDLEKANASNSATAAQLTAAQESLKKAQEELAKANADLAKITAELNAAKEALTQATEALNANNDELAMYKAMATKVIIIKAKGAKKKITVTWKSTDVFDGYQISYKADKGKAKVAKVAGSDAAKKVIKKLKKGKKYTVKVRGYKTIADKTVYGQWSKAKKAKVK